MTASKKRARDNEIESQARVPICVQGLARNAPMDLVGFGGVRETVRGDETVPSGVQTR